MMFVGTWSQRSRRAEEDVEHRGSLEHSVVAAACDLFEDAELCQSRHSVVCCLVRDLVSVRNCLDRDRRQLDELGGDKLEIVVPSLSRKADRRLL